jgi:Leucine-rich repeat (LRR) protein
MLAPEFKSQFESLANLVNLYLYDNSIDNIADFSGLTKLVRLYMCEDPLEDVTCAISTLVVNGVTLYVNT